MRIELLFGELSIISKELRPLAVVPIPVIPTQRMVVCDRTTRTDHGL